MAKVQFKKMLKSKFNALSDKDKNVFYHTTDDDCVYLGDIKLNASAENKIPTFSLSGTTLTITLPTEEE